MGANDKKTLKELAEDKLQSGNRTMLGDPVSLKAETSNSEITKDDRGAAPANPKHPNTSSPSTEGESSTSSSSSSASGGGKGTSHTAGKTAGFNEGKSLKELAEGKLKENPSALGDPVSLKAEKSESEITKDDRGAKGVDKPKSKL